ncbi:Crp/Fnr family transcriptional regulator [Streptomyces boncukensis]|uniref:Cyclic nucleotide-binding domain-containing protein n=1 Tax=Streptomyces boncukensis TaxID=2711219 RepID=A0A6G4WTJ7_9ACTN|nr:cyclic nucleotide-binding domain-containing protein [Streptomyces boncukensis]NGO68596.1 cyclic nucleotide-binding domain-containing protein [Streptomyces boncukensis]
MQTMTGLLGALEPEQRERLRALGHDVAFEAGVRIFEEGDTADRFWVLRTGSATLDMHVPGHRNVVIDHVRPGELLGWHWLFPPYQWTLGSEAASPVRALEFDARSVRVLCDEDARLGLALTRAVAGVIGDRLHRARTRLIDLFGPYSPHSRI